MKYCTLLFGVLASAALARAAIVDTRDVSERDMDDDCEEPVSSIRHISSAKPIPPMSSSKAVPVSSAKPHPPKSSSKVGPVSVKPSGRHHHKHHKFPVTKTTIIIVVESYTRKCHGPTTIVEGTETVTVTETDTTTVTFTKGPYTRTKTHLECYTTTTSYYDEDECGCGGWPYSSGEGYTPLTAYATTTVKTRTTKSVGFVPTSARYVKPSSAPGKNTTSKVSPVFTSDSSSAHFATGVFALVAGVVAYLVL
jgi:hypothetical protein